MDKQKVQTPTHGSAQILSAEALGYDATKIKPVPTAVAQWVRSLLQNWRQGTVGTKGRSEVAKSTKKPWKQKGTGRARAGTARSPLWRGGGIIFGPQPRVKKLSVTKQVKKQALQHILHDFISNDRVLLFDWQIEGDVPKTAQAVKLLKDAQLQGKKVVLFVPRDDCITCASFVNIPYVNIVHFGQENAFSLLSADYWICLQKDAERFKSMVSKWI